MGIVDYIQVFLDSMDRAGKFVCVSIVKLLFFSFNQFKNSNTFFFFYPMLLYDLSLSLKSRLLNALCAVDRQLVHKSNVSAVLYIF